MNSPCDCYFCTLERTMDTARQRAMAQEEARDLAKHKPAGDEDYRAEPAEPYHGIMPPRPDMAAVGGQFAGNAIPPAPPRLPIDRDARKAIPVATGFVDYFPDAIAAVAAVSKIGGEQHNPGKPLFWDRSKSTDEADTLMRHFLERGTFDTDGTRHSAKVAWRALALLQKEIEADRARDAQDASADAVVNGWDPAAPSFDSVLRAIFYSTPFSSQTLRRWFD